MSDITDEMMATGIAAYDAVVQASIQTGAYKRERAFGAFLAAVAPLIRAPLEAELAAMTKRWMKEVDDHEATEAELAEWKDGDKWSSTEHEQALISVTVDLRAELAQARAQERERCAKVADGWRREEELDRCCDRAQNDCAEDIAQHIRALAQPVSEPGEQT